MQGKGSLSKEEALELFRKSGLEEQVLNKIVLLTDLNKDGKFFVTEFILAMFLISVAMRGGNVPETLSARIIKSASVSPSLASPSLVNAQENLTPTPIQASPAQASPTQSRVFDSRENSFTNSFSQEQKPAASLSETPVLRTSGNVGPILADNSDIVSQLQEKISRLEIQHKENHQKYQEAQLLAEQERQTLIELTKRYAELQQEELNWQRKFTELSVTVYSLKAKNEVLESRVQEVQSVISHFEEQANILSNNAISENHNQSKLTQQLEQLTASLQNHFQSSHQNILQLHQSISSSVSTVNATGVESDDSFKKLLEQSSLMGQMQAEVLQNAVHLNQMLDNFKGSLQGAFQVFGQQSNISPAILKTNESVLLSQESLKSLPLTQPASAPIVQPKVPSSNPFIKRESSSLPATPTTDQKPVNFTVSASNLFPPNNNDTFFTASPNSASEDK